MQNPLFDTYCGLSCKECTFREDCHCGGCIATGGHPFHGKCDVAECATAKGAAFCGLCSEFPCELLKRYSYDPQHGDNGKRIADCRRIADQISSAEE